MIIKLTNSKLKCEVDKFDYHRVNQFTWRAFKDRNMIYAKSTNHDVLMHRYILDLKKYDGISVDHKDRNGLNNIRDNLRVATRSENMCNRTARKGSRTGYKGVRVDQKSGKNGNPIKFYAMIQKNGENYYIGRFRTAIEAAAAYDFASERIHGEFCNHNGLSKKFDPKSRLSRPITTGITFSKQINRWVAQTTIRGRRKYIGCFKTKSEASRAFKRFKKEGTV